MSKLRSIFAIAMAATLSAGAITATVAEPAEFVAVSGSGSFSSASGSSAMSDPRVSGDWAITQELHCDPAAAGYTCAKWGQAVMSNDGGTWEGEWAGLHRPGDAELGLHYVTTWLSGTGDYEGLHYIATLMGDPTDTTIEGVIYVGPFPATVALGAAEGGAE